MRSNPDADEFVYLKHAWPDHVPLNPFDLQPCSHADACKQPRHFTLSPAGVTAYFSDGTPAEFLTLDAFQREFLLHQQLMRLPLFRHFRSAVLFLWLHVIWQFDDGACCVQLQFLHAVSPANLHTCALLPGG